MTAGTGAYIALAVTVGSACAAGFAYLVPALAAAVLAVNLAMYAAWRIWGDGAADA